MDEVEFHREPPSNIPRWWRRLEAGSMPGRRRRARCAPWSASSRPTPLATIDPEDFVDFTQVRPVVRLTAEGERTIRWPRSRVLDLAAARWRCRAAALSGR